MSKDHSDDVPKLNIEQLVASVDFSSMFEEDAVRKQINMWPRESYARRYLSLQKRTRYRFGREIIRLVEMCVDIADAADPSKGQGDKSA